MKLGRFAAIGLALASGYAIWYHLGLVSGSTAAERRTVLGGDELIERPSLVTNHAGEISAPPEAVWPWLTQVGWHRAGWYTPRWVDQLIFPDNWASADHLDPQLVRELKPGDTIPDGPPGTAQFVVERAEPPRLLVLRSRTHLPPDWANKLGASLDWVWTFSLEPTRTGGTRMLIRNRGWVKPAWLDLGYRATIVPADHIMATGMLKGLADRISQTRMD